MAAKGRPCRLRGQPVEQALGAAVEAGYHLWAGEVFSGQVEGVDVAGRGWAEPGGGILLLALQGGGGLRGESRAKICSSSSVAVRGWTVSGRITLCGSPSPTTER